MNLNWDDLSVLRFDPEDGKVDVVLMGHGYNKINTIRVTREYLTTGLAEAKKFVEVPQHGDPKPHRMDREAGIKFAAALLDAGADVKVYTPGGNVPIEFGSEKEDIPW